MQDSQKFRWLGMMGWLLVVLSGSAAMLEHDYDSPAIDLPPSRFPAWSDVSPAGQPVLFMCIHPQCPCTAASIDVLKSILAETEGVLDVHLLFYSPEDATTEWIESDLWRSAAALPGVHLERDPGGARAKLLKAKSSGHTVVYDAQGNLAFAGGITASRGALGPSGGGEAVLQIARGQSTGVQRAPVFGCSLWPSSDAR